MGNLNAKEIRARLLLSRPYYGAAAMSLRLVETPGIGTVAVDKFWRLYYDPAFLARVTNSEATAAFEHEMGHLLRDHAGRQCGRDHKKWNLAGDAEINDGIQGLPKGCVYPSTFGMADNETAEVYFDGIPDPPPCGGCGGQGDPSQGGGQQGQQHAPGCPNGQDCGSGAGGEQRPWEIPGQGEDGKSAVEGQAIRRQTAEAVRAAGNAPGDLRRWADELLSPPRIPWSQILPAAIRTAVAQGTPQRFRYPARREALDPRVILPRLQSGRPAAALVVDTSGSITDKDLALAIALTRQALQYADLAVYACDTEATRVHRLAPGCMVGGGGTNMMQGIKVALEGKPKPNAVVIITDCYSPWSAEEPAVPVVILTANPSSAPKWAKVIEVEGE